MKKIGGFISWFCGWILTIGFRNDEKLLAQSSGISLQLEERLREIQRAIEREQDIIELSEMLQATTADYRALFEKYLYLSGQYLVVAAQLQQQEIAKNLPVIRRPVSYSLN
ncbi:MAG: hypothetical protein AAB345_03975 [Patescibacteria group bacterium]